MGHIYIYRYGIYSNLGGSLGMSPNSWTRYLANGFVAVKIRFVICEKIENVYMFNARLKLGDSKRCVIIDGCVGTVFLLDRDINVTFS